MLLRLIPSSASVKRTGFQSGLISRSGPSRSKKTTYTLPKLVVLSSSGHEASGPESQEDKNVDTSSAQASIESVGKPVTEGDEEWEALTPEEKRKMRELKRKKERNRAKLLAKWADLPPEEVARRQKISAVNKGREPWNKGKTRDPEQRARIAEKTREAMRNPEIRQKLKSVPKGPMSEETRQRISQSVRRRFAAKFDQRVEELMAQENISREEAEARLRTPKVPSEPKTERAMYMSDEHREKIRARVKELWATPEYRQRVVERIRAKETQDRRLGVWGEDAAVPRSSAGSGSGSGSSARRRAEDAGNDEATFGGRGEGGIPNEAIFRAYQMGLGLVGAEDAGRMGEASTSGEAEAMVDEERRRADERKRQLTLRTRRAPLISTLLKTLRKQVGELDKRIKEFDDKFTTMKGNLERLEQIRTVLDHRVAIVGPGPDRDQLLLQQQRCLAGIQETSQRIRESAHDRPQLVAQKEAKLFAEQAVLHAVGRVERGEHTDAASLATVDQIVGLAQAVAEGRLDAFSTFSAKNGNGAATAGVAGGSGQHHAAGEDDGAAAGGSAASSSPPWGAPAGGAREFNGQGSVLLNGTAKSARYSAAV